MKGIPYNVTVFATNGRGNGPNVSKITYAEEDGKYYSCKKWVVVLTIWCAWLPQLQHSYFL